MGLQGIFEGPDARRSDRSHEGGHARTRGGGARGLEEIQQETMRHTDSETDRQLLLLSRAHRIVWGRVGPETQMGT